MANLCSELDLLGWRQSESLIAKHKSKLRCIQNIRHSTSKNEEKKAKRKQEIEDCYSNYINYSAMLISKVTDQIKVMNITENAARVKEIGMYIAYAELFQDQITRRVLKEEIISHKEKVFSIFEPHTEWIVKGKAGVKQELGLRVCVVTDTFGFTLHHQVMKKETDSDIAVKIMQDTMEGFSNIKSCSFDKGFWSPQNKNELESFLDVVALPKKGRLSKADKKHQYSEEFMNAQKGHSAVESAINAHENHGLDKCNDKGLKGFKRYISLAVLARNIQHLGALLIKKEKQAKEHSEAIKRGLRERTAA